MKENKEIRKIILNSGFKHWEIAQEIGVSDSRFSVWLRKPLKAINEKSILQAISNLEEKRRDYTSFLEGSINFAKFESVGVINFSSYLDAEEKTRSIFETFHAKKCELVIKHDDNIGRIRADHFVFEVGESEETGWDNGPEILLVNANHKGTRLTEVYAELTEGK